MVLMYDHLSHTADVGMVEKHRKGGFSKGSYFLWSIFLRLSSGDGFCIRTKTVGLWRWVGIDTGENFDGQLGNQNEMKLKNKKDKETYSLARDVVRSKSDLTHTTCTECFAEGVIAKGAPTGLSWWWLVFPVLPAFPIAVLIIGRGRYLRRVRLGGHRDRTGADRQNSLWCGGGGRDGVCWCMVLLLLLMMMAILLLLLLLMLQLLRLTNWHIKLVSSNHPAVRRCMYPRSWCLFGN